MITFDELSEAVYEDLNGRIVSVSTDQQAHHVLFECDDWRRDHDGQRRFELVFRDVPEATATPSVSGGIHAAHEHPLLWQHNDEHVSMFFSSSPSQPLELLGALYEAHSRLLGGWRELGDYLHASSELLRGGHGLFAKGPKRIIDDYSRVVGDRLHHAIVHGHTPRGGYQVVLFDECYVICQSVSVVEHEEVT
jgi:hypothetical protein